MLMTTDPAQPELSGPEYCARRDTREQERGKGQGMYRSLFGATAAVSVATVLGAAVVHAQVINEGAQHRSGPPLASTLVHSPEPQPLDSRELLAIQAVGGAVVRGHATAAENADIGAAAQQLEALRAAVESALMRQPAALNVSGSGATRPQAAIAEASAVPSALANAVSPQLANLHEVRLRLQARPEGTTDATVMARRQAIAKKIIDLEIATQAALNAPPTERNQLLASLRERLSSKSLNEEMASRHAKLDMSGHSATAAKGGSESPPTQTPTLTTLARHR